LGHDIAISVETCIDFLEEAVEWVCACNWSEIAVGIAACYHSLIELAELVAYTSQTEENETESCDSKISYSIGYPA
jgi:hypothetical protein